MNEYDEILYTRLFYLNYIYILSFTNRKKLNMYNVKYILVIILSN